MSKVVIKECKSYEMNKLIENINEGIESLGGWDKYVKSKMKVLLKVNLIGPKQSDSAAITNSQFVRALVKILKSKDCEVWIGDSSGGAIAGIAPTKQSFEVSGLNKVAKEEDAYIKNFDKEGVIRCFNEKNIEKEMYLAKPIFDADVVINLPKLKTHSGGIYTGAIKNLYGCVPGLKKAYYHKIAPNPLDFGEYIVDIHKNVKNVDLHIMDAIVSMQGEGPTAGNPYNSNKIIISEDPLALDTVAINMIGININEVPILSASIKRNLGKSKLEDIIIDGDYKSIPKFDNFKLPKTYNSTKKVNYKILKTVINFLKAHPKVNNKLCVDCNTCVDSCPVHAIERESKNIDYSICIECMCCHELCMYKAVDLKKVNPLANIMTKLYRGNYSK